MSKKPISKKTTSKKAPSKKTASKPVAKKTIAKKAPGKTISKKPAQKKTITKKTISDSRPPVSIGKTTASRRPTRTASTPVAPRQKSSTGKQTSRSTVRAQPTPDVVTTIVARRDVGFGNELFIRGEGAGLSWDEGVKMTCAGPEEWRFTTTHAASDLIVKFLINDAEWSDGDNLVAPAGQDTVIAPSF